MARHAYNVIGEYTMMLPFAGDDKAYRDQLMMEPLISNRRAGADMTITYFSPDAARVVSR
ncbi:MAG: hypothetical protein ABFD89_07115 [Bryobacteraceae bacterium]